MNKYVCLAWLDGRDRPHIHRHEIEAPDSVRATIEMHYLLMDKPSRGVWQIEVCEVVRTGKFRT